MAARAIWKGELQVGDETIAVKFYSAVESHGVHFRLLHARDQQPVRQQMVDPEGEEVPYGSVQKGVEVDEGTFVVLKPSELAAEEPPASREIHVDAFLSAALIPHPWFSRPYFLGPDGSEEDCEALARALEETGCVAIARWVMRKKAYRGALLGKDGTLMMLTLRHAEEVLTLNQIQTDEHALDAKELKLAEQLVSALEGPFDPAAYHDEYREKVQKLIEAKTAGKTLPLRKPARKAATASLEQALLSSLKAAKENRVA